MAHLPIFPSKKGKEATKVIIRVARWNKNEGLKHLINQASLQVVVRPKISMLSFLLIWWI